MESDQQLLKLLLESGYDIRSASRIAKNIGRMRDNTPQYSRKELKIIADEIANRIISYQVYQEKVKLNTFQKLKWKRILGNIAFSLLLGVTGNALYGLFVYLYPYLAKTLGPLMHERAAYASKSVKQKIENGIYNDDSERDFFTENEGDMKLVVDKYIINEVKEKIENNKYIVGFARISSPQDSDESQSAKYIKFRFEREIIGTLLDHIIRDFDIHF